MGMGMGMGMEKSKLLNFILQHPLTVKLKDTIKAKKTEFINPIKTDLHSHLLPGIDDGVKTLEESLIIIKEFKALGYTTLITTPHIISDSYPNTKTIILEKLLEVQKALKAENIDINIEAGAEHYVDIEFLKAIENDELVPFRDKYILFETSYISKPIILEQAIFDLQSKGYIPVLAHPERYQYMYNNMDDYFKLKELGVLFQLNIKSLKKSSNLVYKMSLKLIKLGFIDFIGSDVHNMRDIHNLKKILQEEQYQSVFKKNKIITL